MKFSKLSPRIIKLIVSIVSFLIISRIIYGFSVSSSKRLHSRFEANYFKMYLSDKEVLPSPVDFIRYTIQPDDTLWDISIRYGVNIDTVVSYNNIKKVHNLKLSNVIFIPTVDGILHTAASNDTVSSLSSNYNVSENDIILFNKSVLSIEDISNVTYFIPGASFSRNERLEKLGMEFLSPMKKYTITCLWGTRIHPITKKRSMHAGIDLGGVPIGAKIYSARGGVVTFAGTSVGYGKMVIIKHSKKRYSTRYAHLNKILVKQGQRVSVGHPIGELGKTGNVTGPHLHFEVRRGTVSINPRDVTDFH
jgi:murein DD-endopeptidase MepM/ murein hydrolase activator NlpD